MIARRIGLLAVTITVIAAVAWSSRGRSAQAAATDGAAPGQLTLLNSKGDAVGLCPLRHTDVTADIAGYVARVTVKQEFVNPSKEPVEALYSFPLPSDAAVDDMTMTIGTRVVRGQIKRKEEARAIYDEARASGRAAALLDQERPNIFTQQVANIMPGERVVITISYVNMLKYQEGEYEFVFPMVVGPRYVPGTGYISGGQRGAPSAGPKVEGDPGTSTVVLDAHRITPPLAPRATRAGHDISLTVRLDAAGIPLQHVAAGLHKVNIAPHGSTGATITLANQQEIPNKDFILRYTAAGSEMAEGVLAYAPTGVRMDAPMRAGIAGNPNALTSPAGYFTMIIQPPMAPPKEQISPKEMVFVIDQTGSQTGWPIAKAKETMKYCIANMNPGDTFQLIGFNTAIYPCFDAPVHATAENVTKALKFLEPIEGGGGTDILKSVDYALNIPDDPDRLRIVCYMTDGYVGNDMQILDYIRKHRGRARMFPFGIGNSVNRFLIEGMAREGCGAPEYVAVNTNAGAQFGGPMPETGVKGAKDVAERFYRRIASPLLLDVHVDWNGLPVEDVYPKQIPDVFSSGPIILKGRYARAAEGDIVLRGMLRGKPWSRTIHVSLPAPASRTAGRADAGVISTLWAREKIEDLQSQDWLGAQTNSPHPEITQQIINTALEYHLMSQYTSFVAVEQRVVNIGGKQRLLDVPAEVPEGVSYESVAGLDARRAGKVDLLTEFGITGQVLANADDNSIILSEPAGSAGKSGGAANGRGRSKKLAQTAGTTLGEDLAKNSAPASVASKPDRLASHGYALGRIGTDSKSLKAGKRAQASESSPITDNIAPLDGEKMPAPMTAGRRRVILEQVKLSPALRQKLAAFRKVKGAKSEVLEVQIWIGALPANGLKKLQALGFRFETMLTPNRLLIGTISIDKLDALVGLSFVRGVELPKFRQ